MHSSKHRQIAQMSRFRSKRNRMISNVFCRFWLFTFSIWFYILKTHFLFRFCHRTTPPQAEALQQCWMEKAETFPTRSTAQMFQKFIVGFRRSFLLPVRAVKCKSTLFTHEKCILDLWTSLTGLAACGRFRSRCRDRGQWHLCRRYAGAEYF